MKETHTGEQPGGRSNGGEGARAGRPQWAQTQGCAARGQQVATGALPCSTGHMWGQVGFCQVGTVK